MTETVDRDTLMAHRILASGLARSGPPDAVLATGLQDRDGNAAVALAARDPSPPMIGDPHGDSPLALAWTLRGTPHVHPREDLQRIADALWPSSEDDAGAMLAGSGKALAAQGIKALPALVAVAEAMRRIVSRATPKAELSTALTAALPARYVTFCAPCGVDHVPELLFRWAALPAGLGLVPGRKATLEPFGTVTRPSAGAGRDRLVHDQLALWGAATKAEVAAHVGTKPGGLPWPATVPVTVDGERLQTTPELLERMRATDPGEVVDLVRLLPPGDPLLQPRVRGLIDPDRTHWKALWPALGPAGALLVGGRIAGTWRPRAAARTLTLTVQAFGALSRTQRGALDLEAQVVCRTRGFERVAVTVGS